MQKFFSFLFLSLFFCLNNIQAQEASAPSIIRGLQFYNEAKFDQALSEFSKVLAKDPSNIEAHYYRGLTFLKAEKNTEAVAPFKKVLELDPAYSGAHRNLGIVYFNLESSDLALEALKKSIDLDPQDASAYLYLGFTLQQKEQYKESLIYFQTVLSLDPDLEQLALFQIGLAYFELGQKEDAKFALNMALEKNPESETADQVEILLNELGEKTSKSKKNWWFLAKQGFQYDDNVSVTSQDIVSNQSDMAATFELSTGYKFYSTPIVELRLGYDYYQNAWTDAAEFNYISNTFSLGGTHNDKNWDAGLDYYYNYSFLDEKDYLTSHSVVPRIGFSLQPELYTNISAVISETTFLGDELRNALNVSIGFDQYLFFAESKAYAFVTYRYYDENTKGSEFDYVGNLISAGYNFSGPDKTKFQLSYLYNLLLYENVTESIGKNRRDEKQTVQFTITHPVLEFLNIDLDFQYNLNNSNLVSVDSKQNLLTLKFNFFY